MRGALAVGDKLVVGFAGGHDFLRPLAALPWVALRRADRRS